MSAEVVLVDTSVCVDALRGEASLPELSRLALMDRLRLPAPVLTELLAGARPGKDRVAVEQLIDALPVADLQRDDFLAAGTLGAGLRRHGVTVGTVDLLLAALSIRRREPIWSLDIHFVAISRRFELKLHMPGESEQPAAP
jgi:predicted nucleic acid-binding protein